ncbi:nitroreductase family protein [Candidatus Zixiibacteriota bacterium]
MLKELIMKTRSYRRFDESVTIEPSTLEDLVDFARCSPSSANLQPLKYVLCSDRETVERIFPHLRWAGYLEDWKGPAEGEHPTACIVILGDTEITSSFSCDHGIAAHAIMLGATEKGLGGCVIGSFDKGGLRAVLGTQESRFEILLVLALGKPIEEVILEDVGESRDIRYWRDEEGRHHVPKRPLEELIVTLSSEDADQA